MPVVGIPKEIKTLEKRVGLIPAAVQKLTEQGIEVLVETRAGLDSGFSDALYEAAGAVIAPDAKSLYSRSEIIQKVKEPLEAEYDLIRPNQTLFAFLHLSSPENCALIDVLKRKCVTAIAYETLEKNGKLPILAPMSVIAGGLSAVYAALISASGLKQERSKVIYPRNFIDRLSEIARDYPSLPPLELRNVLIFGGGMAGTSAMNASLKLGASVTVIEKNATRREEIEARNGRTLSPDADLRTVAAVADVLIGCVHIRGERAFRVMSAEQLSQASLKKKKIIMDVSIDQGGNFPEARPTAYTDPVYYDSFGNKRFGVANIPAFCGAAASEALSKETALYTAELGKNPEAAFVKFPELCAAINIEAGKIKIAAIEFAHQKK